MPEFRQFARALIITAIAALACRAADVAELGSPGFRSSSIVTQLRTLLASGSAEAAAKQAQALLADDPDDAAVRTVLGDILFSQARFEKAETAYREAAAAVPELARAHWGLGRIALLRGRTQQARTHFLAAFQRDPRDPEIILSYAEASDDPASRVILLKNYLAVSRGREDQARMEDVAGRLDLLRQMGGRRTTLLQGASQFHHLKLAGYFPQGAARSGVTLSARVNGSRPLRLVLDTGADGILLNRSSGRSARLEPLASASVGSLGSHPGANAQVALSPRVSAGDLAWENCLVKLSDANVVPGADGVIGIDLFKDFLMRIDLDAQTLDLSPLPPTAAPAAAATPLYRAGHFLLAQAQVLPQGKTDEAREGYFLLDTGSSFGSVVAANRELPGKPAEVEVQGAGRFLARGQRAASLRLQIGGTQLVDNAPVALDLREVSRTEGIEIAGILGYPLLRKTVLVINYRDGQIEFAPRPN